ncbi:MAG: MYXO-CTERM sorting domain-containing protein [bacterium]
MSVSAFLHYDGVPPGDYRESDLMMRYGMGDWSAFDSGGSPPRPPSTEWEFIGEVAGDGRPMEGELAIHIAWAHEIPGFTLRRVCATMSYLRQPDVPPPPPAEADEEAACGAAPGQRPGWGHLGLLLVLVFVRRRRPR